MASADIEPPSYQLVSSGDLCLLLHYVRRCLPKEPLSPLGAALRSLLAGRLCHVQLAHTPRLAPTDVTKLARDTATTLGVVEAYWSSPPVECDVIKISRTIHNFDKFPNLTSQMTLSKEISLQRIVSKSQAEIASTSLFKSTTQNGLPLAQPPSAKSQSSPHLNSALIDLSRGDTPRVKLDTTRLDTVQIKALLLETAELEASGQESSSLENPVVETLKLETSDLETSEHESSQLESLLVHTYHAQVDPLLADCDTNIKECESGGDDENDDDDSANEDIDRAELGEHNSHGGEYFGDQLKPVVFVTDIADIVDGENGDDVGNGPDYIENDVPKLEIYDGCGNDTSNCDGENVAGVDHGKAPFSGKDRLDCILYYAKKGLHHRRISAMKSDKSGIQSAIRKAALNFQEGPDKSWYYIGRKGDQRRLVVAGLSEREALIGGCHLRGEGRPHRGVHETHAHVVKGHYWPGVTQDIKNWVRSCPECAGERQRRSAILRKVKDNSPKLLSDDKFTCRVCEEQFVGLYPLIKHMRVHPDQPQFHCPFCEKSFAIRKNLMGHIGYHVPRYQCAVCNKSFADNSGLRKHKQTHFRAQLFKCQYCEYSVTREASFVAHMATHTGEIPYRCETCDEGFRQLTQFNLHKRQHAGKENFQCNFCAYMCDSAGQLKAHMVKHTGEKNFLCTECGQSYSQAGNLKNHMATHLDPTDPDNIPKLHKCDICSKIFASNSGLRRHMKSHDPKETLFQCPYCVYSCSRQGYLTIHMSAHTGEDPFKCDECSTTFKSERSYNTHMALHTGKKSFRCAVCGYTSLQASVLKSHMMIHTGEKNFVCEDCGKAFRVSSHLRDHKRTHTGEKPYRCLHCGCGFNKSKDVQKHIYVCPQGANKVQPECYVVQDGQGLLQPPHFNEGQEGCQEGSECEERLMR